ncbi:hypothetical protein [Streptomyces lydicus]|uniref:hypothetical protein n=1 Tax=Streptomyces lydicus TaxID=47763 RepID=UPI0010105CB8|nr:hypothetical protein [Streptomyces lydicus]MCZ1011929.1 hypothetical protein [Streptomyces lydicus]
MLNYRVGDRVRILDDSGHWHGTTATIIATSAVHLLEGCSVPDGVWNVFDYKIRPDCCGQRCTIDLLNEDALEAADADARKSSGLLPIDPGDTIPITEEIGLAA